MNKIFKKFLVVILALTIVFTSTISSCEKTNAAGITLGTRVLGAVIVGGICIGCYYISNPDKYADLRDSMNDFANTTVENQKKIYEIEKANFEMVMNKAVDAGVGTCLVGPNGVHITAKQLQQQEYPEFDTWKGYKEKESQKPSGSLWKNFQLGVELADMLIGLFSNNSGDGNLSDNDLPLQRWYTGDDGYIDRETGQLFAEFHSMRLQFDYYSADSEDNKYVNCMNQFTWEQKFDNADTARVAMYVDSIFPRSFYVYDADFGFSKSTLLYHEIVLSTIVGSAGSANYTQYVNSVNGVLRNLQIHSLYEQSFDIISGATMSYMPPMYYTVYPNYGTDERMSLLKDWHFLSTNLPVFDTKGHALAYLENGSLEGLLNGSVAAEPTPTEAPAPPSSTVSPVSKYVNYFANTFSPSVMPYYVNYNIVNNWDGNDTTFNINDYTGVLVPTLTPAPDADGKDTNVTNNILIVHTNILTEINETVTNIYNFFQIDVDYITEELQVDSDENPTGFDNLKNLLSEFESAFPADKFDAVTQELDLLYPKITIKVPKALDKFLKVGDDKIILEDGVKKIVLCDFNEYAIYFVRFRKFLEIVLRIGLIFYLLKELTVVFTVA